MRFGLSSVCPLSLGSPFIRPHRRFFPFFSFMSFCLHVSSSSSFLSLARTIVRTLVCTHTRTRTLLTARFRWPRFVTMRFGSSVVPLHLVPFHRRPLTPLSVSSFSFSSVLFACTCAHLLSGQDGGHTCLPSGRRVTLGITGILSDCFALVFCFGFYSGGTQHFTGTVSNEATSEMGYPAWPAGRTCNFPFPNGMRLSLEPPDMTCTLRRHLVGSSFVFLFLATSRIQWFVLVPLGIGTLGRRVAPLSSQYAYP